MPGWSRVRSRDAWVVARKQFLVTHVQVMLRNHKRLALHTSNWIFCSTPFHRLGVSKENGRHDFNFPRQKRRVCYDDSAISHDTENILAANKLYLDADFVKHVAILKEDIGM